MLKVLEMMKVLTNSTTKANDSRIVWNGPMKDSKASPNSSVASSEVMTSVFGGSTASIRARTASMSAPGSAFTEIWLTSPGNPSTSWAVSVSNTENVAPTPALSGKPHWKVPVRVKVRGPVGVTTWYSRPSSKS